WGVLQQNQLTLVIGQYAQAQYLKDRRKKTLTATVQSYKEYAPDFFPLPHPSPRNNIWLRKNPWFTEEVLPILRRRITSIIN
ncbi:MAG: uracil-DNA glycosylase family protein, partial [Bacteroidota bacterium]